MSLDERLRWLALLAGAAIVATGVATSQVPRGTGLASADVTFVGAPTGELGISPTGSFLTGTAMRPGSEARGSLRVTNQTGKELAVLVRALPESEDLDAALHVEVDASGRRVFEGTLGDLRHGARIVVARGDTASLDFRAWLPESLDGGYGGRVVSVAVELGSEAVDA